MDRTQLSRHLGPTLQRLREISAQRRMATVWFLFAFIGLVLFLAKDRWELPLSPLMTTLGLGVAATIISLIVKLKTRAPSEIRAARLIERQYPELKTGLLAAVEQPAADGQEPTPFMQQVVIEDALRHSRKNNWPSAVPASRLLGARISTLTGMAALLAVAFLLNRPSVESADSNINPLLADNKTETSETESGISVDPGHTEIERGTSLLVLASFADRLPADIELLWQENESPPRIIPMDKSLDDAQFVARVPSVRREGTYVVQFDGQQSESFNVKVFDFPELNRMDAQLTYPEYTGIGVKTIEDTRKVTVVEGTNVRLLFHLNKAVAHAELEGIDGTSGDIQLTQAPESNSAYQHTFTASENVRFKLRLRDDADRENRFPPEISVKVLPNRPPSLKLAFPGKDMRVSPLEELAVEAEASDDFGLTSYGVIYGLAGKDSQELVLGEDQPGGKKVKASTLVSMEALEAEPDQLVSYYFFADDHAPDGELRRTFSDMYFAEVRHFEEIFRQGEQQTREQQRQQQQQQQQGQPQGGQGQKAEELSKLQKEIINATWNVVRSNAKKNPDKYTQSVQTLIESQQSAIDQTAELEEKLEDEQSKVYVDLARTQMQSALDALSAVTSVEDFESLKDALVPEQGAYQALLKLRAREFEVQRQQQQQGQQQGQQNQNNRSQQQLNQLELNNKQNRYESKSEAQKQQDEQQQQQNREQLQILNRLRELARRQTAINEKLKELESELRQAKTEEEKAEIERQLKRLREEQQQMLRDMDETKERMDEQQNPSEMAEAQQQMEQTRENVRRASEALEKGQVSKALSEGTRAERDLEELRDDFRDRTANQFAETMKEMRKEARQIQENQEQISEQIKEQSEEKSLRYNERRQEVEDKLREQGTRVTELENRMRSVVEEAEENEPLLSKQLYDTVRRSQDTKPAENLELASELVKRGFLPQAGMAEEEARKGVEQLTQGVEKAAESVLGSEAEALKRAREELNQLTRELENEIAQADPSQARQNRRVQNGDQQNQNGRTWQNGLPNERNPNEQNPQQGNRIADQADRENRQQREGQQREGQQREGQQREGQQREGQQREGQQREGQQREGQQREGQQREGQQREGQQREGQQREGQQREGQQREGQQREGQQREGQQREGQQREGQQREGQQREGQQREGQQRQPGQRPGQQSQQPGQQPQEGQQPGQQPQEGQQPGQQQQPGQRPGQQGQNQQGGQRQGGRQNADNQNQTPNEQNPNQRPGEQNQPPQRNQNNQQQPGGRPQQPGLQRLLNMAQDNNQGGRTGGGNFRPLTGENYRDWSDRLRDVEEMVDDPDISAEVARIRDRARSVRAEFKRHSKEPNWELVRANVLDPLVEVQNRVADEVLKKEKPNSLVPIDRDPVPDRYTELVRRYYEELGRSGSGPRASNDGADQPNNREQTPPNNAPQGGRSGE